VYRWVFTVLAEGIFTPDMLLVLQSAQRPNFKFEEPEMHHQQEQAYFAGKQSWEPITLTWYDVEQHPDVSEALWNWIQLVSNFEAGTANAPCVAPPEVYKKDGLLDMLNGCGEPSERWKICNAWPKESNWGNLDYTSTDIATIEVQMRFDRAYRQF
jgi:phage tail-like protein